MLFSIINTLVGQPESFWQNAETAIRGDGLSIHHKTNHTFEFFLGRGWQAYLCACVVYCAAAFLLVSVLPRTAALIAIFSFIFGHYYGASNWLAVRWHLGMAGGPGYGIAIAVSLVLLLFPTPDSAIIKRLRWMVVGTILLDGINTLAGQPGSYWQHPETVHEGNRLSYFFLSRGYMYFCVYELAYMAGIFLLVSVLPRTSALVSIFAFIFGHFIGAANWFFYVWRMGMEAPVVYGIILSVMIVRLAFPKVRKINDANGADQSLLASRPGFCSAPNFLCP